MHLNWHFFEPYLLIMAWSAVSRKTRGLGFPSWGFGVMVPTSTKPKPILYKPSTASPFLSKPAAIPMGFLNFNPKAFVCCRKKMASSLSGWKQWLDLLHRHQVQSTYQRWGVLVTVKRDQTQANHFHRENMGRLCPHKPLQQGHKLVGIETLISNGSEVRGKEKATWADHLHRILQLFL